MKVCRLSVLRKALPSELKIRDIRGSGYRKDMVLNCAGSTFASSSSGVARTIPTVLSSFRSSMVDSAVDRGIALRQQCRSNTIRYQTQAT